MTKSSEKLYTELGQILCYLQGVELAVTMVVWMIDSSVGLTIHPFDDFDQRTLGALMKTLRARIPIEPRFITDYWRFVKNRNSFIHDFALTCDIEGQSRTRRKKLEWFLKRLSSDASRVNRVFIQYLIQGFSLWDDKLKEGNFIARLKRKGVIVPRGFRDTIYGRGKNPLNVIFNCSR
jgi:hypothetical protein